MKGGLYYNLKYSVVARKPKLVARLVCNTLAAKVFHRRVLRYVDVCLTTRCNLKCAHCFASALGRHHEQDEPLSLEEWSQVARQCMELGCTTFGLTGGEPLLFQQLPELIACLGPERNLIALNTNATLMTAGTARELYAAGLDIVQMSVDSIDPREHDAFRGRSGAYEQTLRAVDICLAAGLKVTLACTVSHQTVRSAGVQGVIDYGRRRGLLVILSRAAPAGEWLGNQDVLLTKDDQDYLYGLVRRHAHVRTDFDTNFRRYGCSAATEKVYVTPYGEVIPCPYMHITFGNVRSESVRSIRERMLSVPRLNHYSQVCHVAEDRDFIENVMARTFAGKRVFSWTECFGDPASSPVEMPAQTRLEWPDRKDTLPLSESPASEEHCSTAAANT